MRFFVSVGTLVLGVFIGFGIKAWLERDARLVDSGAPGQARIVDGANVSLQPSPYSPALGEPAHSSAATLSEVASIDSNFTQTLALYELLAPLDAAGIERLMAEADGVLSGSDYRAATAIMIARLAELNPYRALELADAAAARVRREWLHAVFHAWARRDVQAAQEAALGLSLGARRVAGTAILDAREDLPLAERQQISSSLGTELLVARSGNHAEAWQLARDEPLLEQRYRRLAAIAQQWGMVDPQAALAALEEVPEGSIERSMTIQIVRGWAQSDPQAALDWVLRTQTERQGGLLMQAVFGELVQDDLTTAIDAALALPETYQAAAMRSLLPAWTNADLNGATNWVRSEAGADSARRYFRLIAAALRSHGESERWRAWFDSLTDAEAELVLPSVIDVLALENAEAAAARVSRMENETERQRATRGLLRKWAQEDPRAAADWIDAQEASQRRNYRSHLLRSWIATDQAGARAFTLALPSGEERDEFLLTLMGKLPVDEAETLRAEIAGEEYRDLADQLMVRRARRPNDTRAPIYVDPVVIDRR